MPTRQRRIWTIFPRIEPIGFREKVESTAGEVSPGNAFSLSGGGRESISVCMFS